MSENKHTPEPWAIDPDDRPNMHWNNHIVSEANPNIAICFMAHDGTEQNERGEANARRVVACVNACAGIDTELLEIIADNDKTLAGVIANVEKQRDELLAALEKMNRAYVILMESARDRICDLGGECDGIEVMERNDPYLRESRAAIASVKGGAA